MEIVEISRIKEEKFVILDNPGRMPWESKTMQVKAEKEWGRGRGREEIISGTPNYYRNSPPNPQSKSHFYRSVCQIAFADLSKITLKVQI